MNRSLIGVVLLSICLLCLDVSVGAAVPYQVTAAAGPNGSLDAATPSPATVEEGLFAIFVFHAATGYHVADITDSCGSVPYHNTLNTVNLYPFFAGPITGACGVSAAFAINSYQATASAGTGGGLDPSTPSPAAVDYGSTASFTFNAAPGYHITAISGCGAAYSNSSQGIATYTFTTGSVTADCAVSATFAINQYEATATAGAGGSLDASTPSPITLNYLATTSFIFNASPNHHVSSISGCNGTPYSNATNGVTSRTYSTGNITGDCTVSASFAADQYAVTFLPGANGMVNGVTSQAVAHGGNTSSVTAVPNAGFHFSNWTGTGGFVTTASNPLIVTNVTSDMTITANFAINNYSVSFQTDGNGTLSGTTPQAVAHGGNTSSVTAVPNAGYHFTNWTGTAGFLTTSSNPLTVTNVTSDMTITANFASTVYTISGNAGLAGVVLSYDNGGPMNVTSDGSGNYSIQVPHDWTGTVTPSMAGYTFTPASRSYSLVQSDQPDQVFVAAAQATTVDVPTLSEWGMILFLLLAGLGSIHVIRRRYRQL